MKICPFRLIVIAVVLFRIRFQVFVSDVLILIHVTRQLDSFQHYLCMEGGGVIPYKKDLGASGKVFGLKTSTAGAFAGAFWVLRVTTNNLNRI